MSFSIQTFFFFCSKSQTQLFASIPWNEFENREHIFTEKFSSNRRHNTVGMVGWSYASCVCSTVCCVGCLKINNTCVMSVSWRARSDLFSACFQSRLGHGLYFRSVLPLAYGLIQEEVEFALRSCCNRDPSILYQSSVRGEAGLGARAAASSLLSTWGYWKFGGSVGEVFGAGWWQWWWLDCSSKWIKVSGCHKNEDNAQGEKKRGVVEKTGQQRGNEGTDGAKENRG